MTSLQDMVRIRQGVLSLVLFRDVLDDSVGRAWDRLVRSLLRANKAANADEIDAILDLLRKYHEIVCSKDKLSS